MRLGSRRREGLIRDIRRKTGFQFSRLAVESLLDNIQATELLLQAASYKEPTPVSHDSPKDLANREKAKPEIEYMTWEEYLKTMVRRGRGTRKPHAAIDALVDDYQPPWTPSMRRLFVTRAPAATNATDCRPDKEEGALAALKALPSRIRINSVPAKRILDSLCDDILAFSSETDPLIIVRPYKVLTLIEDDIRARMSEIDSLHNERVHRTVVSNEDVEIAKTSDSPTKSNDNVAANDDGAMDTGKCDEDGIEKDQKNRIE